MIADAANSAGDIFASLMTFIGNKIASKPGDSDHNFGHGKSEYIFSLLISISMIAVSIKLLIDSITSLIFKNELTFSLYLVIVCIVTIITKALLYLYTNKAFRKFNNILFIFNRSLVFVFQVKNQIPVIDYTVPIVMIVKGNFECGISNGSNRISFTLVLKVAEASRNKTSPI